MSKKKNLIIIFLTIIIDQLTKIIMIDKKISVIPNFLEFNYTQNTGIAFSLANNYLWIITIFNIIIIGVLIYVLIKCKNYIKTPLILIIAGATSNLIDRILRGYVIDFIKMKLFNFPTFNIADILIVIGTILLILLIIKNHENYSQN